MLLTGISVPCPTGYRSLLAWRDATAIDGIVNAEVLFHAVHERTRHSRLVQAARKPNPFPNGEDTNMTSGTKSNATDSNATGVVYSVPVDFSQVFNTVNLLVVG